MGPSTVWRGRLIASMLLALGVMGTGQSPDSAMAAAPRPNVVIIYMDDFSPLAAGLWSRASRTPALARFVDHGIQLNASGSTPLCCPARANVLTGRYGHRTGVTRNDIGPFDPRRTIAVKLQGSGYHTAYVGKFMNGLRDRAPARAGVLRYARGWDDFDVIWADNGRFYDYRLWTRHGTVYHGNQATDHSSRVAALRAARIIRRTPRLQPLFMVVSLYDGHEPYFPMARFRGHPACREVEPWSGPSYNEASVSDKPRYVRRQSRSRWGAFSLKRRCEEIMTVDWVTQRIRAALGQTGRLEDTLLIFTADNGHLMREHRLLGKTHAYATPVPMYALWPARWGPSPRSIVEPVSNVDLAPTFCRLAGCRMRGSDGLDILPLLDGRVDHLDRAFIYEEMLHPGRLRRPAWYGIRTTLGFSSVRWVYTEYATGEKELYDLTNDPYQLRNLARSSAHADVRARLHRMLWDEVIRPDRVRFSRIRLDG